MPTSYPDDINFRHYSFFGDSSHPLLNLKYMFKNIEKIPVTDYERYTIGLTKKKQSGGYLKWWRL